MVKSNKSMAKKMFVSINGNEYGTPVALYDNLDKEFNFTHDLAATNENTKCKCFYTREDNSLTKPWHKIKGWLWLNPPYSPLRPWIEKAQHENSLGAKIVILCPLYMTAKYFSIRLPSEIRMIKGRIAFVYEGRPIKGNTHDSSLLIYDTKVRQPLMTYVERDDLLRDK